MEELKGISGIQPEYRKPRSVMEKLEGFKSKIFKDSVMEPGFIESLTAPEGSPIDYENVSSLAGGRIREAIVDPLKRYGKALHKGFSGKPITIKDQLDLIEGMIDTTIGGLFTHGVKKGGFDPNDLYSFPAFSRVGKEGKLIGGQRLKELGSPRPTKDIDLLIYDESKKLFDTSGEHDIINAAKNDFLKEIWNKNLDNEEVSLNSLLELKGYSFIQHLQNMNFEKAATDEFDIKFLAGQLGEKTNLNTLKKHVAPGELSEVAKVVNEGL